jgi:hypothetical protein
MTLNIGGRVHDPTDPVRRLLFNVLAMIAEFESGLIRMRTREAIPPPRTPARPEPRDMREEEGVVLVTAGEAALRE